MDHVGQILAAVGQAVELIGAVLLFGRARWNLRNKGRTVGASTWADVHRLRELVGEMIADAAVGWFAAIILIGLALATTGSVIQAL